MTTTTSDPPPGPQPHHPTTDAIKLAADDDAEHLDQREPRLHIMSLPTELHLAISRFLIYPDALSLKHTNRHFRALVRTDVTLKIEWLLERRRLHLECPNSQKCDLGSDLRFCRGSVPYVLPEKKTPHPSSVFLSLVANSASHHGRLLMKRRRQHFECETRPGLGCLVYGTSKCFHQPKQLGRWRVWFRRKLTVELWWILLALLPLVGLLLWGILFSV